MRVAVRRMRAAVELFRPYLPKKHAAYLRRDLRRLGHALGPARDCDVMLANLRGVPGGFAGAHTGCVRAAGAAVAETARTIPQCNGEVSGRQTLSPAEATDWPTPRVGGSAGSGFRNAERPSGGSARTAHCHRDTASSSQSAIRSSSPTGLRCTERRLRRCTPCVSTVSACGTPWKFCARPFPRRQKPPSKTSSKLKTTWAKQTTRT